jgi:hypothetical protein
VPPLAVEEGAPKIRPSSAAVRARDQSAAGRQQETATGGKRHDQLAARAAGAREAQGPGRLHDGARRGRLGERW